MSRSEEIKDLASALAKAQGAMKGALKDTDNAFFKSKYADLASVVEAIRVPFSENGLSYVQTTEPSDKNEVRIETVILHSSGQWISSGILSMPVTKADAQGYGSALTYARRYSLAAAAGVAPEDDDGNAATKAAPKAQNQVAPPARTWNEAERAEAKIQIGALADDLMEWGVEAEEIETLVSKPRLLIGDETVDFDRWANRLMGLHDRLEKKYKKESQ